MKIFGTVREIVSLVFRKGTKQVTVDPASSYAADTTFTLPDDTGGLTAQTLVTTAQSQVLTNKTLTTPVISSISNTGTLTLPTSTDTLIGRITTDTGANRLKNKDLEDSTVIIVDASDTSKQIKFDAGGTASTATTIAAAQTSNRTVTLPNATTTLLGTDVAQVVTAKDIDGGTASDTSRITVPKAATATLTGLTRKQGTIVYDTTENKLKVDDGTNLNTVGSGSSGEINYISNFDFESGATTGWATYDDGASATPVNGTGGSPATLTLTANSTTPLRGNFDFKVAKSAADSQGEGFSYDFTIKAPDVSKKLKIQFDLNSSDANYTAGDVVVYVYDVTNATLITPSVTALPKMTGTYQITFDSTTSTSYRLIFHWAVTTATAVSLYLDNIIVGPGIVIQGAAIGGAQSVTFTSSWTANTTLTATETRIGQWALYRVKVACTGAPTAADLTITLPSGRTLDTSVLPSLTTEGGTPIPLSTVGINDGGTAGYTGSIFYNVATNTYKVGINQTSGSYTNVVAVSNTVPITFGNTDYVEISFMVPIAEWAGSGTVNLAQNDVEYAYNTSTNTTTNDLVSFGYGPAGAQIQNITAGLVRRVRFQTPIRATDRIEVEVSNDRTTWYTLTGFATVGAGDFGCNYVKQSTTTYGIGIYNSNATITDIDIAFGQYSAPTGATYASAGVAWSASAGAAYWRAKKTAAGAAVGFGTVSETSSGLMPANNSNLDNASATRLGLKSYMHGTTYNGGNAPTITLASGGGSLSSVIRSHFMPYQMQDGTWRLKFSAVMQVSSTSRTGIAFAVNGVTSKNVSNWLQPITGYGDAATVVLPYCAANSSNIMTAEFAAATQTFYRFAGDIELESKPTWAY